jgi:hypothetical protein
MFLIISVSIPVFIKTSGAFCRNYLLFSQLDYLSSKIVAIRTIITVSLAKTTQVKYA